MPKPYLRPSAGAGKIVYIFKSVHLRMLIFPVLLKEAIEIILVKKLSPYNLSVILPILGKLVVAKRASSGVRIRAPLESVSLCTRFSGFSTIASFGFNRLS